MNVTNILTRSFKRIKGRAENTFNLDLNFFY